MSSALAGRRLYRNPASDKKDQLESVIQNSAATVTTPIIFTWNFLASAGKKELAMKTILKLSVMILIGSLLGSGAQAASEEYLESLVEKDLILNKTYPLKNKRGKVVIIMHKQGHAFGRSHIIELRPNCSPSYKRWQELQVADMESQCFLYKESLKYDPANEEITIVGHELDYDLRAKNMEKNPPVVEPACDFKHKIVVRLSTKDFCVSKKGN